MKVSNCFNFSFKVLIFGAVLHASTSSYAQNMFIHLLGMDRNAPYTWVGLGGDALWTNPQNWSDNAAPGLADTAKFIAAACTSNCSPTINTSISIGGIEISAGYPGTITQAAGQSIIIGSNGWSQLGGTFVGSDSNMTVNSTFTLTGGSFTATSAQMLVTSGFNTIGGSFLHNNGLLRFDNNGIVAANSTINVNVPSNLQLYRLQYSGGYVAANGTYKVNIASGSFDVQNDFQLGLTAAGATGNIYASGGSIQVKGNLIVDPGVKLEANTNASNIILNGTGAQTYSSTSGRLPNLTIDKASGAVTPLGGTTNLTVESFTLTTGSFTAPAGVFKTLGNFAINGGTFTENGTSLSLDRFAGGGTNFTVTLPNPITVSSFAVGGGQPGSGTAITWNLAGASALVTSTGSFSIGNNQGGTGAIVLNGGTVFVGGNYTASAFSGNGTTNITFNGSGAQSFTKSGSGSNQSGTITVNKSAGTLSLLSNAVFNGEVQDFLMVSGIVDLAGRNLAVGNLLEVGTGTKLICNGGIPTYSNVIVNGEVACASTIGVTWTGLAGNNQWSTNTNWTNNILPTSADIAIFNSACTGANCNALMPAASISVKGLRLNTDYPGTLTAGTTLTVGTSGYIQTGGSFIGTSSAITYTGFYQLSGGSYTAPTGITIFRSHYTLSGSPTFNNSLGTYRFEYSFISGNIIVGTESYHNVSLLGSGAYYYLTGSLLVDGELIVSDANSGSGRLYSGTIVARGNATFNNFGLSGFGGNFKVAGNGNQTITGNGTTARIPNLEIESTGGTVTFVGDLRITRDLRYTSGALDTSSSTFIFVPGYDVDIVVKAGSHIYNHVHFETFQGDLFIDGNMTIGGDLVLNENHLLYGANMTGSNLIALGNVSFLRGGMRGTSFIVIAGSNNQTVTGSATGYGPSIEFAKSGGTVTLSGRIPLMNDLIYTSGTVDPGTSTIHWDPGFANHADWNPGAMSFYNLTLVGSASNLNLLSTATVLGTLTLADANNNQGIISGDILAYGDVIIREFGKRGTGTLRFVGSNNQTFFGNGRDNSNSPAFEFASTGGVVFLSGMIRTGYNMTYTSGSVNAGSSTLVFYRPTLLTPGPVMYNNVTLESSPAGSIISGSLRTAGLLWIGRQDTYPINTGTLEIYGDFLSTRSGASGNAVTQFLGSTSSVAVASGLSNPTSQRHPNNLITVNKTAGARLVLGSPLKFNEAGQSLRVVSGTLNLAGSELIVNNNVTIDPGGSIICNGGSLVRGSLTNNGIFDCGPSSFHWTGAGGNTNWNNTANWSGGNIPGTNDVAFFSNTFCISNCDVQINIDPNVKGIRLAADYTGTISQVGGVSINLGSEGWVQAGGQFIGGNSPMVIGGPFNLSGGSYTATTEVTTIHYSFNALNTPFFDHNFGTFLFTGLSGGSIVSGTLRFFNARLVGNNASFSLFNGTVLIDGNLEIGDTVSSAGGVNSGTLSVGGNVSFINQGYIGSANLKFHGATAATLNIGASAAIMSGDVDVAKHGSIRLLSTVSFTNSISQKFTVTSGLIDLNGQTLNTRIMKLEDLSAIACRGGSYVYSALEDLGATIACGGYPFFWVGAGANANWNTAANWSGGVVPNNTQVAIFSNSMCASNCNPTLNVNPNIRGLYTLADYSGTITQGAGIPVTIGNRGFNMSGGTFLGSDSNMSVQRRFFMSAGTYRASSAETSFGSDGSYVSMFLGVGHNTTFLHNNGNFRVNFNCVETHLADFSRVHTVYNLTYANSCTITDWQGSVVQVANDLTILPPGYGSSINNLRLKISGDFYTGNNGGSQVGGSYIAEMVGRPSGQTITATTSPGRIANLILNPGIHPITLVGNILIGQNFSNLSNGIVNTAGSQLLFNTGNNTEAEIVPGSTVYNDVVIQLGASAILNINGNMSIGGNLTLMRGSYDNPRINRGVLSVAGNVTLVTGGNSNYLGTATVRLTGNPAGQLISGADNVWIPNLEIAAGTNNVTMSGSPRVGGLTNVISGNVNQSGATFNTNSLSLGGNNWVKSSGLLQVNGVTVGTGSLFGGTVSP